MTNCPICALLLEVNRGAVACRACGLIWLPLADGNCMRFQIHYTVCVACGQRIIDNPSWHNNHKCPPKHDASRGERAFSERGRSVSDRLADGFDLIGDCDA